MIRVPLLTLTLAACAALRPLRAPQPQKNTVLGRRDLGAAACAAVAFVAQSARAEPRDQWIAAQKEIDAILADRDTSKQQKILAINRLKALPATVKQKAMQAAQTGKDFTI